MADSGKRSISRTNILHIVWLILLLSSQTYGQIDNIGSGRALRFDGVDDYIDLGNVYDDLSFPFTISAWVFIDGSQGTPGGIFDSQNIFDTHYNGFWFTASPSSIALEYGDGQGTNSSAFRRGKGVANLSLAGRWNHVAAVVNGISSIEIYLNGRNMGGSLAGGSGLQMASSFPNDDAHIGNHFVNGVYYRFKGMIDELRIFNRSLSAPEIREQMCRKLAGNEAGLIGYWTFDETGGNILADSSPNSFAGTLVGNPVRVFSGAPIGDESTFHYTNNWLGAALTENDFTVENVSGNPFGVHIYKINDFPSQTGGVPADAIHKPYYGVFVADATQGNTFGIRVDNVCKAFYRNDNSEATWIASDQFNDIPDRKEMMFGFEADVDFQVTLGEDQTICDQPSHFLTTGLDDTSDKGFLWSTGETSSSISVAQSGTYWVSVTQGCTTDKDSIVLSFVKSPSAFSLGNDEVSCDFTSRTLQPLISEGFEWTWSDGSGGPSLEVTDFGVYWLEVKSVCGSSVDSISFSKFEPDFTLIPNCITPNGDAHNQRFTLPDPLSGSAISIYNRWGGEVYRSTDYHNTWDAQGLAAGVYYYVLNTRCSRNTKGIIHVLR